MMVVYMESSYLEHGIDLGLPKRPVQFVIHGPRISFPDLARTRNALSNSCTNTEKAVNFSQFYETLPLAEEYVHCSEVCIAVR